MSSLAAAPPGLELLDDPAADPAAVRTSLRNIARSNRWFGGRAAVLYGLEQALAGLPAGTTLSLVDVGTGLGDLPRAAVRWAGRRGWHLRPTGLDRHPTAARCARDLGVAAAVASGHALPLRNGGADLVLVSQVLHHLDADQAVSLLRECNRVARRAVVVADLRRHRLAAAGFWLAAHALGFDPATRADGVTSVRRGYSRPEFAGLMARAGVAAAIWRRPGFRLVAVWRPAA